MAKTPTLGMDKAVANQIIYNNRLKRPPKRGQANLKRKSILSNLDMNAGTSSNQPSDHGQNVKIASPVAVECRSKRGRKFKMYTVSIIF